MNKFLVHWAVSSLALALTAWVLPGVHIGSASALLLASIVLGLLNAVVKPILFLLTLPLTVFTLGLFYFILNALLFAFGAKLVPGFDVAGFGWAFFGAILMSVVSSGITSMLKDSRRASQRR